MPKETLSLLERDTERLLFAGAQVARSDADLEARRQKLAPLAAKAPALAKVVEQIEKVQKASGKTAAVELLNLSAMMAQVRGAQAALAAAAGDLAPLPPAEPLESPLSPTELLSLVNALTVSGKGRPRIVADAVERGAVRDLRLLPFCVRALGDPAVGYVVQDQLLPKLGRLVVPELRATLRLENGKELDAKKLRVLSSILAKEAEPLLVEATEKGSPEVRRTAIEELGELDATLAEPIALRLLAEDRSMEVRKAAAAALGGGSRDETLDALFKAFTEVRDLRRQAGTALAKLAHPRTTERALALLTPDLLALANLKLPKADTPAKKKANEKLEQDHAEKVRFLAAVLDLLASRKDRLQTAERVLGVFHDHKIKEVKNAAALALLKSGFDKAFDELAPSVYEADWQTQDGFVEGILEHDPEHAFERLGRFLDARSFKGKNHVGFAQRILATLEGHSDDGDEPDEDAEEADDKPEARPPSFLQKEPRWVEAAIALLDHKELAAAALDVLGKVKSDRARDAVIALAASQRGAVNAWRILRVLAVYRDARIPPLMIRCLDLMNGSWVRRRVFGMLREYDDATVVPALRAWGAAKKKLDTRDKEELESTLLFLERDRVLAAGV
jgi:HEAT repeat protein